MKAKSHDFRKQQCFVHKSMSCTCFASEKIPDLMPPISVTLYSGLVTAHLCESSACVGVGGLSVFLVWWTVSRKRKVISFNHLVFCLLWSVYVLCASQIETSKSVPQVTHRHLTVVRAPGVGNLNFFWVGYGI